MINFEKKLKAELQKKDKDTIIDLYLQKCYEFELEKAQLQQQLDNAKIEQLEKVNELLTNTIIEVTQEEFDLNKLCYLEEISAKFCEKINQKIQALRSEKGVGLWKKRLKN